MKGSELRRIRKQLGLTQQAFAEKMGVAPNSVARWERGEMKITETAAKLAVLLGRESSTPQKKGRP